jgi:hypothetical protein
MDDAERERAAWSLNGNVAELNCGAFRARVDSSRPDAGLQDARYENHWVARAMMSARRADGEQAKAWPLAPAETYVRGNDLVATYQPTSDWPFSPQLYWRAATLSEVDGVLASASLLVSVQTDLLDTCPRIAVGTQLSNGEVLVVSRNESREPKVDQINGTQTISGTKQDYCILSRPADSAFSYVEVMPRSDFHEIWLRCDSTGIAFEWRLFADFLEKGVIRRALVHASFMPRENDIERTVACCEASKQLELPLTT